MRGVQHQIRFEVHRGKLVRYMSRPDGRGHIQRASLAVIKEVAWFIEEHADDGVSTNQLWDAFPELPATQLSVALSFLKERGCVVTCGRRNYAASNFVFEDAMIEYHALET